MTTNDGKSYLTYLDQLADQYNNIYHHSINKKPINAGFPALTEKIESYLKALKIKFNDRIRITKYKNILRKVYAENLPREIFVIYSVLKTNPWTYNTKE